MEEANSSASLFLSSLSCAAKSTDVCLEIRDSGESEPPEDRCRSRCRFSGDMGDASFRFESLTGGVVVVGAAELVTGGLGGE